jgi:hypothetical protein
VNHFETLDRLSSILFIVMIPVVILCFFRHELPQWLDYIIIFLLVPMCVAASLLCMAYTFMWRL